MANPVQLGPFLRGVAGPPIVIPTGLPFLELYLDARTDFATIANGTSVSQWNDLSGNGRHAVQAVAGSRPTVLNPGSPNGSPYVRFTRGDTSPPGTFMGGTIPLGTWPTTTRGYTVYFVGKFNQGSPTFSIGCTWNALGDTAQMTVDWDNGTGGGSPTNRWAVRTGSLSEGSIVSGFRTFVPTVLGSEMVATYVFTPPNSSGDPAGSPAGGPLTLYHNAADQGTGVSPDKWRISTVALANYALGSVDGTGSFCGALDLGAYLWYSNAHPPAIVGQITRFLRRQYGV